MYDRLGLRGLLKCSVLLIFLPEELLVLAFELEVVVSQRSNRPKSGWLAELINGPRDIS